MRLRSGKIITDNEAIQKKGYIRRMENPPNNNGETTVTVSVFETIPSTASTMAISSSAHSGTILSLVRTKGQQMTPHPVGSSAFRPYVAGFMRPLNGREQPYGMPTSMLTNFHNAKSTLANPLVNMFSPLQGFDLVVNNTGWINQPPMVVFPTQQMPNFTTNSGAVLRQLMDKINHEMVHMLAQ